MHLWQDEGAVSTQRVCVAGTHAGSKAETFYRNPSCVLPTSPVSPMGSDLISSKHGASPGHPISHPGDHMSANIDSHMGLFLGVHLGAWHCPSPETF